MVNNSLYGMTGGQMSPTSLAGQVTATTAKGRDVLTQGYPLLVPEMMRAMSGVAYLAGETVVTPKSILKAAKSIRNAFECQIKNLGFSYVEMIEPCPTGLRMKVEGRLRMDGRKGSRLLQTPGVHKQTGAKP